MKLSLDDELRATAIKFASVNSNCFNISTYILPFLLLIAMKLSLLWLGCFAVISNKRVNVKLIMKTYIPAAAEMALFFCRLLTSLDGRTYAIDLSCLLICWINRRLQTTSTRIINDRVPKQQKNIFYLAK